MKCVCMGFLDGVKMVEDCILIFVKVGNVLVGILEVSLLNGNRYGVDKL